MSNNVKIPILKVLLCIATSLSLFLLFIIGVVPQDFVSRYSFSICAAETSLPEIISVSGNNFQHPGIGFSEQELSFVRDKLQKHISPWIDYYNSFASYEYASKNYNIKNQSTSDSNTARYTYSDYSSSFMENVIEKDAQAAYMQALMYYFTGDKDYRANSLHIIRLWSQLDPSEAKSVSDGHIKMSFPLYYMVSAAELLKYTSCDDQELAWTDTDNENFIINFVEPAVNCFVGTEKASASWMNQYSYALLARIAADIFIEDYSDYTIAVEMASYGKSAGSDSIGSVKYAMRQLNELSEYSELDDTVIEIPEMGRDQAHACGNVGNLTAIAYIMNTQNTLVSPVTGEVSASSDAVDLFTYLNNRILRATNAFYKYNLGYKIDWYPILGYDTVYDQARGRAYNAYSVYYYYAANNSDLLSDTQTGAYLKEYYEKKSDPSVSGVGYLVDDWIHIPDSLSGTQLNYPNETADKYEIENRYTLIKGSAQNIQDGEISCLKVETDSDNTVIALLALDSTRSRDENSTWTIRVKTTQISTLKLKRDIGSEPFCTMLLPDTNGEWRDITAYMDVKEVSYTQYPNDIQIVYAEFEGDNNSVELDTFTLNKTSNHAPKYKESKKMYISYKGASFTANFSADDYDKDTVSYSLRNNAGILNSETGEYTYTPSEIENTEFIVQADDGQAISVLNVRLEITETASEALKKIEEGYSESVKYQYLSEKNYFEADEAAYKIILADSSSEDINKALENLQNAVNELKPVTPIAYDGSIDYRGIVTTSLTSGLEYNLLDSDTETFTGDLMSPNNNFTLDFGVNYKVIPDSFIVQPRKYFPARIHGIVIYGSNDSENWIQLTNTTVRETADPTQLPVISEQIGNSYRYLKIQASAGCFNLAEFRIFGSIKENINRIDTVSISMDSSDILRAVDGDTVKLDFTTIEKINNVSVTIEGQKADIVALDDTHYTAEVQLCSSSLPKMADFTINYSTLSGEEGATVNETTDGSGVFVSNNNGLISLSDFVESVTDLTPKRSVSDSFAQLKMLYDAKSTNSDFRTPSNDGDSYFILNMKYAVNISRIELLPRQDRLYSRIVGLKIEGSNDLQNWTPLTEDSAKNDPGWQIFQCSSSGSYKYIKFSNNNKWYGNLSEMRIFTNDMIDDTLGEDSSSEIENINNYVVDTSVVKYQLKNNGDTIRFVMIADENDVLAAKTAEAEVRIIDTNAPDSDPLIFKTNITSTYRSIYAGGKKVTAPDGKLFLISSEVSGVSQSGYKSIGIFGFDTISTRYAGVYQNDFL